MTKIKMLLTLLIITTMSLVITPTASAFSGVNANNVKVKVYAKQGNDWFRAIYKKTNSHGVLVIKNVLPGKYKVSIRKEDKKSTQILAAKFRMSDKNGVRVNKKTDVDVYMYINGVKTLLGTWKTNKNGWVKLSALLPDTEYYLDVKDEMHLNKKKDEYKIKINAKIEDSNWFRAAYKRTNKNKTLKISGVLPGKYKFKYKGTTVDKTFNLSLRMLDNNAKKIKKPTVVKLYTYINKQKVLIGTLKTDNKGRLFIPNVVTNVKYDISVK